MFVQNFIEHFTYVAIVLSQTINSVGIPLPEESVLLITGYLTATGLLKIFPALFFSILAVFLGDNVGYWTGRVVGCYVMPKAEKKMGMGGFVKWLQRYMANHEGKTVFFSRFVPALRMYVPLTAGCMKMKYWKFFILELIGALIWVPFIFWLGYHFSDNISYWLEGFGLWRHILAIGLILIVLPIVVFILFNKYWKKYLRRFMNRHYD
ncbi:MAG: DedA family protein [Nanoarchaeota archaeon]|nr:DedA family protein [Nanoarchaeota archaeon]